MKADHRRKRSLWFRNSKRLWNSNREFHQPAFFGLATDVQRSGVWKPGIRRFCGFKPGLPSQRQKSLCVSWRPLPLNFPRITVDFLLFPHPKKRSFVSLSFSFLPWKWKRFLCRVSLRIQEATDVKINPTLNFGPQRIDLAWFGFFPSTWKWLCPLLTARGNEGAEGLVGEYFQKAGQFRCGWRY